MMKKEILSGLLAGILLLLFYFVVMGLTSRSWSATVSQFRQLWYWMILLSGGFGVQVGLYTYIKYQISPLRPAKQGFEGQAKSIVTTSTGTSALSMIACCIHHLADILPIVGLSSIAIFLTNYQIPLIVLGIIINLSSIIYMLHILKIWAK